MRADLLALPAYTVRPHTGATPPAPPFACIDHWFSCSVALSVCIFDHLLSLSFSLSLSLSFSLSRASSHTHTLSLTLVPSLSLFVSVCLCLSLTHFAIVGPRSLASALVLPTCSCEWDHATRCRDARFHHYQTYRFTRTDTALSLVLPLLFCHRHHRAYRRCACGGWAPSIFATFKPTLTRTDARCHVCCRCHVCYHRYRACC